MKSIPMKKLFYILILVPLLLASCSKDPINQEDDGYATIGSFERLEYSAVLTEGCDVSTNVTGIVDVPDLYSIKAEIEESTVAFSAIGVFILKNVGVTIASTLWSKASESLKEYFFGPDGREDDYASGNCRKDDGNCGESPGFAFDGRKRCSPDDGCRMPDQGGTAYHPEAHLHG